MEETLRPCPFCGAEAELVLNSSGSYFVRCTNKQCAAKTRLYHENENGARLAWNRRAERTCHMVRDNLTDTTYCDVCGERFDQPWYLGAKPHGVDILVYHVEYRDARYCPHCGARVVGE